jgi:hypothetical protein
MGPDPVQDQRGGVQYHQRNLKPTPFVLAAFATLGLGAMIAIVHSGAAVVFGLICLVNLLIWLYLAGPASSVTVRHDILEIDNALVRYAIPRGRVLSIEYVDGFGVRVRIEGDKLIWVGVFTRALLRWKNPSTQELKARAQSLTDALFPTPAPADHREVETSYRWGNLVALAVGAAGLAVLAYLARQM